jgi:hypothetical protein
MPEAENQYCIIRMRKVKMTALKASQIHNERLTDRHSNPDIDTDRSDQNIVFFRTEDITDDVKKRVADIQSRQKRKIRCDAPVAIEYMITASPKALERLSKEEQERFFAESLSFVEARHGTRNRLSAVLHLDETTPHLHLLVFPEREGKLDAKTFFKLPAMTALQDEFALKVGKHFGMERGVRLSELLEKGEKPHRHQSVAVYKAKKLKETERKLAELEQTTADLAAVEAITPKKGVLSSRVSVTPEEFETLSGQAKAYVVTKETLAKRSKSLIAREQAVSRKEALLDSSEALREQNKTLSVENSLLRDRESSEKAKNTELRAKLRKFDDYEETKRLLKDTQTALAEANSQLAKEKEEHEKTKGKLQAQAERFEAVVRGARALVKYLYQKFDSKKKALCEVTLQEFANFLEKIPHSQQQTKNKAVEQKRVPER